MPEENEELLEEKLLLVDYGSTFTVINLGSLYLLFVLFIFEGVILCITRPCRVCPRFKKVHDKLSKALFWNSFLRLLLEASLELAIATFNNIHIV
jgi:hypothetical protein